MDMNIDKAVEMGMGAGMDMKRDTDRNTDTDMIWTTLTDILQK